MLACHAHAPADFLKFQVIFIACSLVYKWIAWVVVIHFASACSSFCMLCSESFFSYRLMQLTKRVNSCFLRDFLQNPSEVEHILTSKTLYVVS